MSKKYTSTLEYYNYWEQNNMNPSNGFAYKVKVSDKDGNIITIEKDGALFAMVGLELDADTGILKLTDVAHSGSTLAEVEMPDADYIYNCRFDETKKAILFDVKSLYGDETSTIELDVESLIELYDAGDGIEIGEKDEATGRRPISIKLVDGENILQLSESGLSISDTITTDDELVAAISGKADTEYVDELFESMSGVPEAISSMTEDIETIESEIEKIKDIIGTDEDDPSLDERIDSKADLDEFNDLENEVGELEAAIGSFSGGIETINEKLAEIEAKDEEQDSRIENVEEEIGVLIDAVSSNTSSIAEINEKIEAIDDEIDDLSDEIDNNKVTVVKLTQELPPNVREAYILKNNLGEQLGERIDIYQDSSLISIEFIPELQVLRYKFYEVDGTIRTVDVDLSALVVESEFKDGLVVTDGKVSVKIDPSSDGYLTVSENGVKLTGVFEMFGQLLEVNSQQWSAITAEASARQQVESQLWNAINNEAATRAAEDTAIREAIVPESVIDEKIADAVDGFDDKINAEKERAELAEANLNAAIQQEKTRAESKEAEIARGLADETEEREAADLDIRQDLATKFNNLDGRITGFEEDLAAETEERQNADAAIEESINEIRRTFVTKEYVDRRDSETLETAKNVSILSAKTYTDTEIDKVEVELKRYCDSGHTELQEGISENATKINAISNLYGVTGDDTSNYDDSGNGILDVLHREFHEYVEHAGILKDVKFEDGNLIFIYETPEGEKTVVIPVGDIVDLSDYYKKEETDALLDEKLDVSAYTDISAQVSANTESISLLDGGLEALIERLGYTDNDTLNRTGEKEVAFGQYNISVESDDPSKKTLFSIGNGADDENRSNALEVKENGDVYLWVEGEFMNINKLLGQIAHEIYDADSHSHFFDGN